MIQYLDSTLLCENKWAVDLNNVEFITMKQNWDDNNYHIKLHIGTKEVRFVFETKEQIKELTENWIKVRNKNEYNKQTR